MGWIPDFIKCTIVLSVGASLCFFVVQMEHLIGRVRVNKEMMLLMILIQAVNVFISSIILYSILEGN